jgi:glutamate 5-kinase
MAERDLSSVKRVVVKLGTSIMTGPDGHFSHAVLRALIERMSEMISRQGIELIVVTSGAIGLGMEVLGLKKRPGEVSVLQACAAVGQGKLMSLYEGAFSKAGHHTAQVLLTRGEFGERKLYLNARRTLLELLKRRVIPIINENDTVATDEIRFGDNDTLAAMVAQMVRAELTILLSDVEGFFLKSGVRVECVRGERDIEELQKHLYTRNREHTVGGMATKLGAARIVTRLGLHLMIADGRDAEIFSKIWKGENVGTLFLGAGRTVGSHKSWLTYGAKSKGTLTVDPGAAEALSQKGKSLLARGITAVSGTFKRGDVVLVANTEGVCIGVGKTNYTSSEIAQILGRKTEEIAGILGCAHKDEVIHHNNWASLRS